MKIIDPSAPGTEREIQQRQEKERLAQNPAVSTRLAKRALFVCAGLIVLMGIFIVMLFSFPGITGKWVVATMFLLPSIGMSAAAMLALHHSLRAEKRGLFLLSAVAIAGGLAVLLISLFVLLI